MTKTVVLSKDDFNLASDDPYEILGVPRDATPSQIRRAYRRACMQFHPDRNDGTEASKILFQKIHQAYETLTDFAAREFYDNTGMGRPTDSDLKDRGTAVAHQTYVNFLSQASDPNSGVNLDQTDISSKVVEFLENGLVNMRKEATTHQQQISRLQLMQRRFRHKKQSFEDTPVANIIKDQIKFHKKQYSITQLNISVQTIAIEKAYEYSYEIEPIQWYWTGTSA